MAKALTKVTDSEIARFLDAWFRVRQVIQGANFNHFHQAGLSATQFMTLNLLPAKSQSISMGELARRMNLKPATVAKTVDSLEARKLLNRTKSAQDGRLVLIEITNQGQRFQNAAAGQFRKYISRLFLGMRRQERADLIAGLESLVQAAAEINLTADGAVSRVARAALPAKRSSRRVQKP